MPTFQVKARDSSGKLVTQSVEAATKMAVAEQLGAKGFAPVSIEEVRQAAAVVTRIPMADRMNFFDKVKLEDLVIFTRQLQAMFRAGLPILDVLDTLVQQTPKPIMKRTLGDVMKRIEEGDSISGAMARHPKVFSELYVNSIRAGEKSGAMDELLERLTGLLEHEAEIRAAVKSAVRYPIMVVIGIVIAFFVFTYFVIPKFAEVFSRFGKELPLPTRILLGISYVMTHYWWAILAVIAASITAFLMFIRTKPGRLSWDRFKLKLPVMGQLMQKAAMASFAHMFGTMFRAGLPVLQNLDIVSISIANRAVAREIGMMTESIEKGATISEPIKHSEIFPPLVYAMLSIGERSGTMEQMMNTLAGYYDTEVRYILRNLAQMIEPILTVAIAGMVLFMALALFLPMWDMIALFRPG
ncbi:MAG: type II secretion system F family protein [Planctomycetes bacterium]|nr:type II secretion system F family protein [Planctomycetota bacterium]